MSRHEGTVLALLGVIILIRVMESSRLGNAFGTIFGKKPGITIPEGPPLPGETVQRHAPQ